MGGGGGRTEKNVRVNMEEKRWGGGEVHVSKGE